ncbi:MAG TPA: tRNA lysidine(34) synthetase TilS [Dehalococcoidia bacterium]|nr:tRNA lysidine(34) synthetase TilS [Dehalococcoidia bacterium]
MPRRTALREFERRLLAALPELPLVDGPPRLIVAASGGADSTALLLALRALAAGGFLPAALIACHIDHGLRPEAARLAEQALLAANCRELDVPLLLRRVQVETGVQAPRGVRGSAEAAARRARYAALGAVAAEIDAAAVLTAHTAGDQAETVLLRLLRGTGVGGLAAMPPRSRPWGDGRPLLLRPLLGAWPEQTRGYCRERGVSWSEDETNASPRFARNRVRHELLPLLRSLAPGAERSLLRLAGQARELDAWLDGEVERLAAALWRRDGDGFLLKSSPAGLAPFIGKQLVARVLAELLGGAGAPGARQVAAVFSCWRGTLGRRCDVGQGWRAEATLAGLRFRRLPPETPAAAGAALPAEAGGCRQLAFGQTELPGWRVTVSAFHPREPAPEPDTLSAYLVLPDPVRLSVRGWRAGDRMRPAGLGGSKKLQDIFVDEQVERARRPSVPLLFLDGECIWAVGVKRSALAPAAPPAAAGLRVAFTPFAGTL